MNTLRPPQTFHVMVTDINSHVRALLLRELEKDGYAVFSVATGAMVYKYLCRPPPFHVVILDPELFAACDHDLLKKVLEQKTARTIIVHTYRDTFDGRELGDTICLVEKCAASINFVRDRVRICYLQYCKE